MNKNIDDGGPAFPRTGADGHTSPQSGMSLRDYFAAYAMNGICSSRSHSDLNGHAIASARVAYNIADAMLKARKE
jgi:hypothetical protein